MDSTPQHICAMIRPTHGMDGGCVMARVLVIVPFAFDEKGLANRRSQLDSVALGPDLEFDFRGVKAGPALLDCYHDYAMADIALFEAGAQRRGRRLRRGLHRHHERFGHERAPLRARHPGDRAGPRLLHDGADARQPLLGRHAMGRLDPALQEGLAGIRRRRQARLHPLHQRDAGRGEPAGRQGGGGLPQAGGLRHALHRGRTVPR